MQRWTTIGGMSLTGLLSLVAVVSVLVFISVPRLRGFAQNENEADARDTVRLLARQLGDRADGQPLSLPRIDLLAASDSVSRGLSDADYLSGGRLLRRHGYLFAVVALEVDGPPPTLPGTVRAAGGRPRLAIRAWPWKHGLTGSAALLCTASGDVLRHANGPLTWNGPDAGFDALSSWDGWRPVP